MEITPFDNRYSLLYKAARENRTIARLIVVVSDPSDPHSYIPLGGAIKGRNGESLEFIYDTLRHLSLPGMGFSPRDFVMTYLSLIPVGQWNNVLGEINAFLEKERLAPFRDIEELGYEAGQWKEGVDRQAVKDYAYLEHIISLQDYFAQIEPLPQSGVEFNRLTITASPSFLSKEGEGSPFDGTIIDADLGEEVFDQAGVFSALPLILFTDHNGRTLSKIWSDFTLKSLIPDEPPPRNSLFLLVWTGLPDERVTKESFTVCRYDLNLSELTVDVPIGPGRGEDIVLDRISQSLPVDLSSRSVGKRGGDFRIYGVALVEPLFLDMLLLSDLFYAYMYMPEESKPASEKKKFTLHLRTLPLTDNPSSMPTDVYLPSSVAAALNQYSTDGESVPILTPGGVIEEPLPSGTPYLICTMGRANSSLDAKQFQEVLSRLCRIYLEDLETRRSIYLRFFPEARYSPVTRETERKKSILSRLAELEQLAPEVFVKGYARKCQGRHQPVLINRGEVAEWEGKTFTHAGRTHQRQVLSFPPLNPKYYIVCPDDEYPFPGVRKNGLGNKNVYPYLPCCYGSDQMGKGVNSDYNVYYSGKERKYKRTAAKTRIISSKIAGFKRRGNIPSTTLVSFLSSFFPGPTDFVRVGVPRDTNSAISCLLLATQPDAVDYSEAGMASEAARVRSGIDVHPALLKQELYDLSDEDILRQLDNQSLFFDPFLFYRALEEVFQVNVVTFVLGAKDNVPLFEIPRAALYHTRIYRDRPLVLLYKNFGSESDALTFPQIELLVEEKSGAMTFSGDVNSRIFQAFNAFQTVYLWTPVFGEKRGTLSNVIPFADLPVFSNIVGQVLDEYGKLRGVITREGFTVYFTPSQPLNLPILPGGVNKATDVIASLGPPDDASYDYLGMVNGLWYSAYEFQYTYYFPVEPFTPETPIPQGPPNPFPKREYRAVGEYTRLTYIRDIILQLISWLFVLTRDLWPVDDDDVLPWFKENFLLVGEDSRSDYSFPHLSRLFPPVSVDGALAYLSRFPGLVRQGKVYLYNRRFADGVMYFLRGVLRSRPRPLLPLPKEIFGIPFRPQILTLIFDNWEQLRGWEKETETNKSLEVRTFLRQDLSKNEEPFFYLGDQQSLFFVQNINEFARAVAIGIYWLEHKINPGPLAPLYEEFFPFRLFRIAPDGNLVLVEDKSGVGEVVDVLEYSDDTYAALLRL